MSKKRQYVNLIQESVSVSNISKDYIEMKRAQGVTQFTLDIQGGILRRFFQYVDDHGKDVKTWKRKIQFNGNRDSGNIQKN